MVAHIREAGPLRVGLRALVILAVDVVALELLIVLLPGLSTDGLAVTLVAALSSSDC
jgi:hypothetical protein